MPDIAGKSAVITGASQGIGQSIARALYDAGVSVVLLGRSRERLAAAVRDLPASNAVPPPRLVEADLLDPGSLAAAAEAIVADLPTIDILVNCGGAYLRGQWQEQEPDTFNNLLATNVVGPYTLTRLLLPQLAEARGDVVFVNSSITRSQGRSASHYKATQHSLLAMADSLRAEFNEKGIRVLSIFPGRTATPRQKDIFANEEREYLPEYLLQPSEIADAVLFCLSLPETAEVTDLYIRPRIKA